MLAFLVPEETVQTNLFDYADTEKTRELMKTMDMLNERLGRNTLILGSSGLSKDWKTRADFYSAPYTTDWLSLINAK